MLLNLFNLEEEEEVEEEGRSHSREQSQSRGLGERRKEGGEERLDTCKGHQTQTTMVFMSEND